MKEQIRSAITRLVTENEKNWSQALNAPYFTAPLVGFASADDPVFERFKEVVGEWHLTPREAFEAVYGPGSWHGGTVVSWVMPWSQELRDSNRHQVERPSRQVTEAYHLSYFTWQKELRAALLGYLADDGYRGVAPVDGPGFRMVDTPTGKSSTWSERHIGYAARLGSFGLSRGFISELGSAVYLSSVVIDIALEPDPQELSDPNEGCLFFYDGSCGACVRRCPGQAISKEGQDKTICASYAYGRESIALSATYGLRGPAGCALCQVKVPCESKNPVAQLKEKRKLAAIF